MPVELKRNREIDPTAFAAELARHRRVQIHDFLEAESARRLHGAISANREWYLSFNRGEENMEVPLDNLRNAPAGEQHEFLRRVHDRAGRQFQYLFIQYYITEMVRRGENPGHPLHAMHDFLNHPAQLEFFRVLTGESAASEIDVLATRYEPGHFLTMHDDSHAERDRVVAYVLNLSPEWNPNWGGHLAFYDERGNIEQAFVPKFNTLNVFTVPQRHAVQPVASFARGVRASLTGWVHRSTREF